MNEFNERMRNFIINFIQKFEKEHAGCGYSLASNWDSKLYMEACRLMGKSPNHYVTPENEES